MKNVRKIGFIVVLIAAALAVINIWSRSSRSDTQKPLDRREVVQALQTFEVIGDFSEEKKQELYTSFQAQRDTLNKASEEVDRRGDQALAVLYWPLISLGNLNRDVGSFARAEMAYRFASQTQPMAFLPYQNLGELYFRNTKELTKAAEYYRKAAEIENPNLDTIYGELYELYRFHLKDEKAAEAVLIEGLNTYPRELNILALLAFYYRDTGQTQKAIERYEEMLAKNPDSSVAKRALEELRR